MPSFSDTEKGVFRGCARAIVHMRKQADAKRLGLVFGSGLSKSLGLPTWPELVNRIAKDADVDGTALLKKFGKSKPLPYQTELLLQHYKKRRAGYAGAPRVGSKSFEYHVIAGWLRMVAKHLYKRAATTPDGFKRKLDGHPYIKAFLPTIRRMPLTVTYNFDNYLERALWVTRPSGTTKLSRGYETVTNPFAQFRRQDSVIFHPNGFYPRELMEVPVDKFVFSEASYAEQFLGVLSGSQTALTNHFAKNTCLLLGLSLEDEMLRNLLVLSASLSPGNYHYYVHYLAKNETLEPEEEEAIRRTNFNVYNLVTLFLHDEEIAALGTLVDVERYSEVDIHDLGSLVNTPTAYRYYITGPLGVGKSTAVNQYRNLVVLDEWLEERPAILGKNWKTLTPAEQQQADDWVANQFKLKNENLRRSKAGVFLVDRPPLDPLAFTPRKAQRKKAGALLDTIGDAASWPVQRGVVILLTGDTEALSARIRATGRATYTAARLDRMSEALKKIYKMKGMVHVDTRGLTIPEVARKIGEVVHLYEYEPCRLEARLKAFRRGAVAVTT